MAHPPSPDVPVSRQGTLLTLLFALIAATLFVGGRRDYPNLHTILDTASSLLSSVLAWVLWDIGRRSGRSVPRLLAVGFATTAFAELVHVLVTVEWTGAFVAIAQAGPELRPSTWPTATYVLPLGVLVALFRSKRTGASVAPVLAFLVVCGIRDITERRQTQDALLESRQHYQALAESLPHLVWTCRADGSCDFLSRQWVEYTGLAAESQLGHGWLQHVHPDDRQRVEAAWHEATVRGDAYDVEFRIRRGDGAYRWFRARAVPLHDSTGMVVKWFGSNTDVDDDRNSQQRLRAQIERMALLDRLTRAIGERQDLPSIFDVAIHSLEDDLPVDFCCVCLLDRAADALVVTRVGQQSGGLADALAMPPQTRIPIDANGLSRCVGGQLVYEPDLSAVPFALPRRLSGGGLQSLVAAPLLVESHVFGVLIAARRAPDAFSSADCEFLRQLSEHVALAAHQAQLYSALKDAYDELRQTQQAVMQQERLKALGQMASGIAHDINNALSPVALYTESLLRTETSLSPRARDHLDTIQRAVDDVAQTAARMREFYRQREPQLTLTPVDVNRLLTEVLRLTRARWSDIPQQRGVVVHATTDLAPESPVILGVESELREGLINLIFNAVDALPDGGTLVLRTRTLPFDQTATGTATRRVAIEVVDSGVGMDVETQRRCFEPFFTTKGERGTGLGLAMVYGMVQRHRADIDVASTPGRGTTVRLMFAAADRVTRDVESERAPAATRRRRILVVDDDPLLLKSLSDTLSAEGHAVTTAHGGQAGIDLFRQAAEDDAAFEVVITDLGMPHVDGRQVASTIKSASPETPVILLTGWGQRLVETGDVPLSVDCVMSKPPKLSELRQALAEATGQRPR